MKFFNRVAVVTATTGTGTLTFGAAVSAKFLTPVEAGAADADETYYLIEDGADFELGVGTVGGSETTLSRDTVLVSKISGTAGTSKIDLSGTAQVRFTEPAEFINSFGDLAFGDDASDVPFTPAGGIAATDVQAAIEELDSEKGAGDVTAASNIGDGHLVVGDGGAKGIKGHASGAPGDAAFKNTGTGAGEVAAGDHTHAHFTDTNNPHSVTKTQVGLGNVSNDAQVVDPGSNGLVARTASGSASARTITGTANQLTVTNGDGVSGNPTIAAVIASQAEAEAGTDTTKLMTPQRVSQAISALGGGGGGAVDRQTFNSSGTWNKPASGNIALIQCWGAGGSGAKHSTVTEEAGGGGGGGYTERLVLLSSLGATETVTVGAGGAGVSGTADGNAGGNTTFGAHLTAYGGGAGSQSTTNAAGGGGGGAIGAGGNASGSTAGAAGQGGGSAGGSGTSAPGGTVSPWGGGGGGGASTSAQTAGADAWLGGAGGGGSGSSGSHANGGSSVYGGNGGNGAGNGTPGNGVQPGGGGGACTGTGTSGSGGNGRVVVTVW
jgi:hypothetical protein